MSIATNKVLSMAVAAALVGLGACGGGPDGATAGSEAEAAAERAAAEAAPVVPAGTELTFVVDETLSTDDTEAGRTFAAHVQADVRATDGSTLIPAGTEARGKVVESAPSRDGQPAVLAVRIESVRFAGSQRTVDGTVISAETEASADDTGAETAGKIAIGAAAGAIIGQILGRDTESTLAGAGAGAIAGAVVALTTRDGSARLLRGSTIVVRLDAPLSG